MKSNIVLVTLIGLPGAGKTTFCDIIKHKHQVLQYYHLCFDNQISVQEQMNLVIEGTDNSWKLKRSSYYEKIESLIINLKGKEPFYNYVLLLDDNFYYKSMRYTVYQIARKYTVGFSQIYVQCSEELCIKRTRNRVPLIPESIIKTMSLRLEVPNLQKNLWEANTLTILDFNEEIINNVIDLIYSCLNQPVLQMEDLVGEQEREECRNMCKINLVHQADLYLRCLVSEKMNALKQICSKFALRKLSKNANESRQDLLKQLRNGEYLQLLELDLNNVEQKLSFELFLKQRFESAIKNFC